MSIRGRHCLPISAVLRVSAVRFTFPMTRDVGDSGDRRATRASPLPASFSHRPHPPRRFVENKGSTPIRPSGDRPVEAPFLSFSAVQSASISACFFRFYCSVGRGSQRVRGVNFWLTAHCYFVKDRPHRTFPHSERNNRLYHLFAFVSTGNGQMVMSSCLCKKLEGAVFPV